MHSLCIGMKKPQCLRSEVLLKNSITSLLPLLFHLFPSVTLSFQCLPINYIINVGHRGEIKLASHFRPIQDQSILTATCLASLHVHSSQADSVLTIVWKISHIWRKRQGKKQENNKL